MRYIFLMKEENKKDKNEISELLVLVTSIINFLTVLASLVKVIIE